MAKRTSNRSSAVDTRAGRTSTILASADSAVSEPVAFRSSRCHRYRVLVLVPARLANTAALSPLASHRAINRDHVLGFRRIPSQLRPGVAGVSYAIRRTDTDGPCWMERVHSSTGRLCN